MNSRRIIGLWLLAILVFAGSLLAANWQYHRHVTKKNFSEVVQERLSASPMSLIDTNQFDTWQTVTFRAQLTSESYLVRKRPLDGRNGLWLVNSAIHENGFRIPVLLGWIPAAAGANVEIDLPILPTGTIELSGIIRDLERSESASDLPINQILSIDRSNLRTDVPFFVQVTSPDLKLIPEFKIVPIPNVSQGPHFFYAIQWLVFGVIALLGSALLTRSELNVKP